MMIELWIIDEAEDFIVLNCCDYIYYSRDTSPPWNFDEEDG